MGSETRETGTRPGAETIAPRRRLSPGPGLGAREVAAHQLARIYEATIQIVAEHGYKALKVRDVVSLAEVSTRAFYDHFGSKDDCFLQAYQRIVRSATHRMIAAQTGERAWRERPRRIFEEFARQLVQEPARARLVLLDAYAAGEASLSQAWRTERVFEGLVAESLARAPDGVTVPPLVVEGIVAGIASVSRDRLFAGKTGSLRDEGSELVDWALCHVGPATAELQRLDQQYPWRDTTLEPSLGDNDGSWPSTGDRALILKAVANLTVAGGYGHLTAPRVRSTASVSRRKFEAYFDGVEDCYLAALDQHAGEALAKAARAQAAASSWAGSVYRTIAALCDHVATDAFLATVCLTDGFPREPDGLRSRERLINSISELLSESVPRDALPSPSTVEASTGAVWLLFHHHIVRDWAMRRQISATLTYMALTPILGGGAATEAIEGEQGAAGARR